MTLKDYDNLMQVVCTMQRTARQLETEAVAIEDNVFRLFRLSFNDRGPGFPGWSIEGSTRHFSDPRQAVEHMENAPQKPAEATKTPHASS